MPCFLTQCWLNINLNPYFSQSNVNGNGVKEVLLPAGSCFIIEKVEEPSGPIGPSNRVKIEMSRVYDPRAGNPT